MSEETLQKIDHNALKANQLTIITLNLIAFIFNSWVLSGIVALVLLIGVLRKAPGFDFIYFGVLKPAGWVKPDILNDHPEPHRFAQLLGGLFTGAGTLSLALGAPYLGWGLIWVVIILAGLNVFGGFCMGCAVYYWMSQFNVPGFSKSPPAGSQPGKRPNEQ